MLNNILEIAIFTNFLLVAISLILVPYAFVKNGIDKGHIITIYSYLVHAFIFYFCRLFLYSQIIKSPYFSSSLFTLWGSLLRVHVHILALIGISLFLRRVRLKTSIGIPAKKSISTTERLSIKLRNRVEEILDGVKQ